MPIGKPGERDRFGRRMLVAGALALLAVLLLPLLGPSQERIHELLVHTGTEGTPQLLLNLDVIPDRQELSADPMEAMPQATQGLELPDERATPVDRAETKHSPSERSGLPASPHWSTQLREDTRQRDPRSQAESHSPSQHSLDFVLEQFVKPEYPDRASSEARARVVLVKVAMYVNEQGIVDDAYIIESDGGPLFDQVVLGAVRQWRYRPVVFDRVPQGFWDQQIVRFVMRAGAAEVEILGG